MYFSRLNLRDLPPEAPELWRARGDAYALHGLIWDLFSDGPERRRDFLYRHEPGLVYAVSARPPAGEWAGEALKTLTYEPRLAAGQRLYFSLRANPVVSRRDEGQKQHRHDVVMEEKNKLVRQGVDKKEWPPQAELVRQAGLAWLTARAEAGGFVFAPASVRVEGYSQHQIGKRGSNTVVRFSTLDFDGLLTVSDPGRFGELLFSGLGPAKGFGCGLMLIKGAG